MAERGGFEPPVRLCIRNIPVYLIKNEHHQTRLTPANVATTTANIRKKDRSPFWFACITLPDGTRTQRSTGTIERRTAQRIANEYEDAARDASSGRCVESRARKVIADIHAIANTDKLPGSTTQGFLEIPN